MEQAGKRRSGKQVTIGFGLLVAVLVSVVIGFWFYGRAPSGRILSFTPIDARRVLLVREGYSQKHLVHLTSRDIERGQIWAVPFHDVPRGARPVVAGSRVLLFVRNEVSGIELDAHALDTGAFAFRTLDVRVPAGVVPEVSALAVGDRVVVGYFVTETHVAVVDVTRGTVVADHVVQNTTHAPAFRTAGSSVVVHPNRGPELLLDPASGTLTTAPNGFVPPIAPASRPRLPFRLEVTLGGRNAYIERPELVDSVYWIVTGTSVAAIEAGSGRVVGSDGPASFVTSPLPTP